MKERGPISNETVLFVLEERFGTFMRQVNERFDTMAIAHSELASAMKALEGREGVRNDRLSKHDGAIAAIQVLFNEHLDWATEKASELDALEHEHHDSDIRTGVWKQQAKWLLGGGLGGGGIASLLWGLLEMLK